MSFGLFNQLDCSRADRGGRYQDRSRLAPIVRRPDIHESSREQPSADVPPTVATRARCVVEPERRA
jgi:hypothetical protein